MDFSLFFTSALLGIGLAMDAFAVSLANGLNEPTMKPQKAAGVAGLFAIFQGLMPLIGWVCVYNIVEYFESLEVVIPYIALVLLSYIGGKMLYDGIKNKGEEADTCPVGIRGLIVQAIATSIDALSVGFTISEYTLPSALICAGIITALTFGICLGGVYIGKKAGTKLAGKAGILGGAILIFIGLEIFISSFFA